MIQPKLIVLPWRERYVATLTRRAQQTKALSIAHHIVEDIEVLQAYSCVLADAEYPQRSFVNGLSLSSSDAQLQQLLSDDKARWINARIERMNISSRQIIM